VANADRAGGEVTAGARIMEGWFMIEFGKAVAAAAMAVALVAGAPAALAAGGGGDSPAMTRAPEDPNYTAGAAAVQAKDYGRAIALLEKVVAKNPQNADALNYLGYSHRELDRLDTALAYYQKALAVDPDHRGAHEYLGELYLKKGDIKSAEAELAKLDDLCTFGCEEYRELKRKIAAYKSGQRS